MGIKPLYFQHSQKHFAFASEIKPLLNLAKSSINKKALPSYLQRRFVMGGETLFSNIFRVKPAEILEFSMQNSIQRAFYWILPERTLHESKKEREEEFSLKLLESVKMSSACDVELGVLLSGGLDSAVIDTLSHSFYKELKAYFFDNEYDDRERYFAQHLSQKT